MCDSFSLKDKLLLITGATSGLGKAIAIECTKRGGKVIITGRNRERLDETYSLLSGKGHSAVVADLTVASDLENVFNAISGKIHGVVFAAGITKTVPVKFVSPALIDDIFETNTLSSFKLVQKLLRKKKIFRQGSIVFISSISTAYADIGNSIYAASKGALNSFSKVLALELAPLGIRSNCIQPGFVPTSMLSVGVITEEQLEEERKNYPLGFGEANDIANGAIYLLSDASKWMTGSVLTIDGGVTLR